MTESGLRELRYDRFRRVTAKRMTLSITTKPQLTLHRRADVSSLERDLADARDRLPESSLSFTAALLAVIARGVAGTRVNGTVSEQVISLHQNVNLGVAVDVDGALMVPVIKNADQRSVEEIGAELKRLAETARAGRLRPEEVDGATFTVSSLGPMGVELFTPIINPPQLAILGVGAIRDEVAWVDDAAVPVRKIGLSLSFDHAATDGADAARALDQLCGVVEKPTNLAWVDGASAAENQR